MTAFHSHLSMVTFALAMQSPLYIDYARPLNWTSQFRQPKMFLSCIHFQTKEMPN